MGQDRFCEERVGAGGLQGLVDRKAAREESVDFGRRVTDAGLDVEDGDTGAGLGFRRRERPKSLMGKERV